MEWIAPHMPKIFLIKGNQLLYRTVLNFSVMEFSEAARMLKEMLRETLVRTKHQKRQLSQQDIDEAQIIYAYLKKHKNKLISVRIPEYRLKNEENLDCVMATIINSIKNSMEKTAE
jgi:excinuclease ABC subunit C